MIHARLKALLRAGRFASPVLSASVPVRIAGFLDARGHSSAWPEAREEAASFDEDTVTSVPEGSQANPSKLARVGPVTKAHTHENPRTTVGFRQKGTGA